LLATLCLLSSSALRRMAKVQRWHSLAILTAVYLFDYIDRSVLYLLAEPIKATLQLSDTQLGLLTTAFTVFHAAFAWPIATFVERSASRPAVLAASILCWAAASAASGVSTSFAQLAACRIVIGVGEATVTPVAQTLLSDLFAPHELTTPLSIYQSGIPFGSFLSYLGGGYILSFSSWRVAFFACSAPGPLLALLVCCSLREPRSTSPALRSAGGSANYKRSAGGLGHFASSMAALLRTPGFALVEASMCCGGAMLTAFLSWAAAWLGRQHGLTAANVGTTLAFSSGLAPGLAAFAWGGLIDRLVSLTGEMRWLVRLTLALGSCGFVSLCAALAASSATTAIALVYVASVFNTVWYAPTSSIIQCIAPRGTRAIAASTSSLVVAAGGAIGAPLVGLLSDRWSAALAPPAALSQALLVVVGSTGFLCLGLFAAASRRVVFEPEGEACPAGSQDTALM